MAGDKEHHFDFCNFILNKQNESPSFLSDILWTNGCQFTKQGIVNTHNSHYQSLQNLHTIRPNPHQVRRLVNVWCGTCNDTLVGQFIFDGTLTSKMYTDLLQGLLSDFLDDFVPIQDLSMMWFQHDGAQHTNPCSHVLFCPQYLEVIFVGAADMLSGPHDHLT